MKEEIFGPFVCIDKFSSEEEAIDKANIVDYGLCASVWSENVRLIHRVSEKLEVRYKCTSERRSQYLWEVLLSRQSLLVFGCFDLTAF